MAGPGFPGTLFQSLGPLFLQGSHFHYFRLRDASAYFLYFWDILAAQRVLILSVLALFTRRMSNQSACIQFQKLLFWVPSSKLGGP